jgi:hypothetical protein
MTDTKLAWSKAELIDALAAAEKRAEEWAQAYEAARAERDRYKAQGDELAEALREITSMDYRGNEPNEQRIARAALARLDSEGE